MILPLQTERATLENAGGKGVNLAKLARAGYAVPGGFLIATAAYRAYVAANDLGTKIHDRVTATPPDDVGALQAASDEIRGWFSAGVIPPELGDAIRASYRGIGQPPVAVRSSATAEDLPGMSFAGQQDTFLNVVGEEALLEAVVDCWSSLWTARAIGYRARNRISHDEVALAVVVQEMVQAEASGVMLTANPLTGLRAETVIDATLGLGEALVSGHVNPDHYVVNTVEDRIVSKRLGAKAIAVRGRAGGGVETVEQDAAERQALTDAQIMALAQLGQRVAAEYGFPQDVEWAWADGQLYVLQARPVTALFPLPEGMGPDELGVFFSFGAVQGIMGPITPLGQDCIRTFAAGGGRIFGYQTTYDTQGALVAAGERLWVNLTPVLQNTVGRRVISVFLGLVAPAVAQALKGVWDDPRLTANAGAPRLSTLRRIARGLFPLWRNILRCWRDPDDRCAQVERKMAERLAATQASSDAVGESSDRLARRVGLIDELFQITPFAVLEGLSTVVAGLLPLGILQRIASHLPESEQGAVAGRSNLALEINRGLPHNVTTEMDLRLWETALAIRSDPDSAARFREAGASDLAADYVAGRLPAPTQAAIAAFMEQYGMRGVGEIDVGRPRWREEPVYVVQVLQGYLRFEDQDQAPDAMYERGKQAAQAASVQLEAAARRTRGGWLKARVVRWAVRRFRALAGFRESPKFFIVRVMGIIRQGLLDSGAELVAAGVLARPDDLFFLRLPELEALARGDSRDWKALVEERRRVYAREEMRARVPRLLLGDGRAIYEGLRAPSDAGAGVIVGSPVSPGVVEGVVRVVLDPVGVQLEPGEILVCPGTDPAWTPLFLTAGGLVMEVGGMITHGAIVAREYGLPAVVGVHQATTRLRSGQRVRVDGSTGRIVVL
jgi:pyruvate,water dikinase